MRGRALLATRARAWVVGLGVAASLAIASCTEIPAPLPPPPPPPAAPAELTGISIYVHQLVQPAENDDDRYDYSHMPGFTNDARSAFALALTQAGYKVVVDRRLGADVTAYIYERWENTYDEDKTPPDGVASLALRDKSGSVIDRLSVAVRTHGTGYSAQLLQGHAASALVEAMNRSEPLRDFAAKKLQRAGLVVAAASSEPVTPVPPPMTFADAVKDAEVARPEEVSTGLIAILPTTPGLVWSDADQKKRVLMVTWTSYKGYDDQKGKSLPLGRETWLTAAPFVANFCKGRAANAGALSARLEQLLGLPANNGKDRFVELWVEPKDLFRPCPDPEITDRECELDFPQPSALVTVSPAHVKWFDALKAKSYGEGGYPWTRLGYTFDWAGPEVGMSEFVAVKGAQVTVERAVSNEEYCR